MPQVHLRSHPIRRPAFLIAGIMACAGMLIAGGCAEGRADSNPFVGTSGAAIEQPYGQGAPAIVNHDTGTRP